VAAIYRKCTFDSVPQSFEDALRDKFFIPWDTQVAEEYITANNPYHVTFPPTGRGI